jgi:hypothetical protein
MTDLEFDILSTLAKQREPTHATDLLNSFIERLPEASETVAYLIQDGYISQTDKVTGWKTSHLEITYKGRTSIESETRRQKEIRDSTEASKWQKRGIVATIVLSTLSVLLATIDLLLRTIFG